MERFTISKSERQTLYEIYRACRLCGAGGGYRMPIVQDIIDVDTSEIEISRKIQECLQLEVRSDDRMPPLICELCVDKLNAFYEFLELTRQTNIKTRTRLGLPLPAAKTGEPEPTDCILGVTEPVYVKEDDTKKSKAGPKSAKKIKKESEVVTVKVESTSDSSRSSRSSSVSSRAERGARPRPRPAPAPARRSLPARTPATTTSTPATRRKPDRETRSKPSKPETKPTDTPKNIEVPKESKVITGMRKELQTLLEDSMKFEDRSLKRAREEPPRPAALPKRARPPPREPAKAPVSEPAPARARPGPKSRRPARPESESEPDAPPPVKAPRTKAKQTPDTPAKPKDPPKPTQESPPAGPPFKCVVCDAQIKSAGAFTNHMKSHVPCFTKLTYACNPCGLWFLSCEEAGAHHRHHRAATFPYHCRRCFDDFTTLQLYDDHIEKGLCVQDEPPQVKCEECGAMFAGEQLRAQHKCAGRGAKSGGKCSKCSRTYQTANSLKKHERQCGQRKAGELIADPDVLRRLKPMRVRITRCDDLLERAAGEHCDVSTVQPNYGLAKNYIYPYMKLPPAKPTRNRDSSPVAVNKEPAIDYTHWDSDDSDTDIIRKVPSLSTLAIKKLFSKNLLGKVPRKRKKTNNEEFEEYNDASNDMKDIISSLGDLGSSDEDRNTYAAKIKDIIGCFDDDDDDIKDDSQVANEVSNEIRVDVTEVNDKEKKIDESTKDNLECNESVDGNCESSNLEDKVTEESIVEMNVNKDLNNEESNINEINNSESDVTQLSNKETDINEKLSYMETDFNEKLSNLETNVSEELIVEATVTDKFNDLETNASEESSNVKDNLVSTVLENNKKQLDDENVNRVDMEIENADSYKDKEVNVSLENNENETTKDINIPVNGINHEIESIENKSDCNKTEETKIKESPIKHSIENLIGEDKNPDKYINEVISSIEDIIMKNPRADEKAQNEIDDANLMEALNEQIGDKPVNDSDKITLEDLLPKENKEEEFENISDDDFDFDT